MSEPMWTYPGETPHSIMGNCETCLSVIYPTGRDYNDNKIPIAHDLRACIQALAERLLDLEEKTVTE